MKLTPIYKLPQGFSLKKSKDLYCVRKFLISILLLFSFTQCYYNPFVYSILNPPVDEEEKAGLFNLGILAILNSGPKSFSISGIVRDGSGIPQPNKSFTVVSTQSTEPGLDTAGTTNSTGRFLIRVGLGDTKIEILDGVEPLVTFTLTISGPNSIQVADIDPASFDIGSLVSFDPSITPVFFDLLSSTPQNNETNYALGSFGFSFNFSQDLEQPEIGTETDWLNANVIFNPPITFGSASFGARNITGMVIGGVPMVETDFTIELKPTIKSTAGVPLAPITIRFRTNNT